MIFLKFLRCCLLSKKCIHFVRNVCWVFDFAGFGLLFKLCLELFHLPRVSRIICMKSLQRSLPSLPRYNAWKFRAFVIYSYMKENRLHTKLCFKSSSSMHVIYNSTVFFVESNLQLNACFFLNEVEQNKCDPYARLRYSKIT